MKPLPSAMATGAGTWAFGPAFGDGSEVSIGLTGGTLGTSGSGRPRFLERKRSACPRRACRFVDADAIRGPPCPLRTLRPRARSKNPRSLLLGLINSTA